MSTKLHDISTVKQNFRLRCETIAYDTPYNSKFDGSLQYEIIFAVIGFSLSAI